MDESAAQQWLAQGVAHHKASQFAQAETLYRRLLAHSPGNARVLHLLGLLLYQTGNAAQGLPLVERSLQIKPDSPDVLNSLGLIWLALDDSDKAIDANRRALAINPDYAPAWCNLGNVLRKQGKFDTAIDAYQRAIARLPNFIEAITNLAHCFIEASQFEQAAQTYERVLTLAPGNAMASVGAARASARLGRHQAALNFAERARAINPGLLEAHFTRAACLESLHRSDEAQAAYQRCLTMAPDNAAVCANFGSLLYAMGKTEEAEKMLRRALRLAPDMPDAQCNLGRLLGATDNVDEAIELLRAATSARPHFPESWANLGSCLRDVGQIDASLEATRRAISQAPENAAMHSNLCYAVHFDPAQTPASIRAVHVAFARQHADSLPRFSHDHHDWGANRRLRIGYVSPNFQHHVVGWNLLPLLKHHDRQKFEVFCYSDLARPDAATAQIRALSDHWRDTGGSSDLDLANQIFEDRIDILVDLTLHMAANRLLVFARKPAPVQLTYLGYCSTSGLGAIDYRFSDPHLDPSGTDLGMYTETTVRLPTCYWCYEPPQIAAEAPARESTTQVTLGCLNSYAKVSDATLALWGRLMAALPQSRLLLHAPTGSGRQRAITRLGEANITSDRLAFVPKQPWNLYLNTYRQIDIAIDPIPYGGGITTCDALWMGTPVVTLGGAIPVSRAGRTILHNIGHAHWIADTAEQYIERVCALAQDVEGRTQLRRTLRDEMRSSPLMNAPRFAQDVEAAYEAFYLGFKSRMKSQQRGRV